MDIYDLIKDEERVSFIGMCKNAGKTTVLNEVIKKLHNNNESILLTSIGRDGEVRLLLHKWQQFVRALKNTARERS